MEGNGVFVTKTYSITLRHVGLVADLSERMSEREKQKISQGEIIRRAIDLLYEKVLAEDMQAGEPS